MKMMSSMEIDSRDLIQLAFIQKDLAPRGLFFMPKVVDCLADSLNGNSSCL